MEVPGDWLAWRGTEEVLGSSVGKAGSGGRDQAMTMKTKQRSQGLQMCLSLGLESMGPWKPLEPGRSAVRGELRMRLLGADLVIGHQMD